MMLTHVRRWMAIVVVGAASFVPRLAAAQDVAVVRGTVTDVASGAPISDARIRIVGTNLQAATDARGTYRITGIRPGQVTIQVHLIGYRRAESQVTLSAGQEATSDFALAASVVTLEEVVVTGTAGDQQRRAQAGTVSNVDVAKLMEAAPVTTVAQALQSRVPGVSVTNAAGTSGTSNQIRLRGASSISLSNEPLLYIDGIRVASGGAAQWFTGGQN